MIEIFSVGQQKKERQGLEGLIEFITTENRNISSPEKKSTESYSNSVVSL